MYNWETVGRTMLVLTMGPFETKTSQPPTIRNLSSGITKFHQELYLSTLF